MRRFDDIAPVVEGHARQMVAQIRPPAGIREQPTSAHQIVTGDRRQYIDFGERPFLLFGLDHEAFWADQNCANFRTVKWRRGDKLRGDAKAIASQVCGWRAG